MDGIKAWFSRSYDKLAASVVLLILVVSLLLTPHQSPQPLSIPCCGWPEGWGDYSIRVLMISFLPITPTNDSLFKTGRV